MGVLLSLSLPAAFLLLLDASTPKFVIARICKNTHPSRLRELPLILPHGTNLVVLTKPKSSVSEAFRALRSNLNFVAEKPDAGKAQVFAVTSSVGGEGKTFLSINLASVLS